jgi:hypothetical protein
MPDRSILSHGRIEEPMAAPVQGGRSLVALANSGAGRTASDLKSDAESSRRPKCADLHISRCDSSLQSPETGPASG